MTYDLGPRLGDAYEDTLNHVLGLKPRGIALEFGVGSGHSLRRIAAVMPVVGFDSFEGLPEDWREGFPAGTFACEVPDIKNAELVVGLYEDTLPGYEFPDVVGLVHIDCDLYSSTVEVLDNIEHLLTPNTYVVFDEFHGYPGAIGDGEEKAWTEFVSDTGIEWEVIGHGPEQWAIRIA